MSGSRATWARSSCCSSGFSHSSERTCGGDLAAAAQAIDEVRAIAEATGTSPVAYTDMTLAAWRGQEALTCELIERQTGEASERGIGRVMHFATYAESVLYNGLG